MALIASLVAADRVAGGAGPIGPVSERTLIATLVLLALSGLMVFRSLVLPPGANRWLNIILGASYIVVMLVTMPGAWWFLTSRLIGIAPNLPIAYSLRVVRLA
jgi:hypothetical protein